LIRVFLFENIFKNEINFSFWRINKVKRSTFCFINLIKREIKMKKQTSLIVIGFITVALLGLFLIISSFKEAPVEKMSMEANVQSSIQAENAEHLSDNYEEEHEHDHSVEIEGSKMKQLTIQQIADLWQINSDILLNGIIQEHSFQENYTTETILEDMRYEYKFSPAVIKDIAEEIKQGQ